MKDKHHGGYSGDDPRRSLMMRESIYNLAFAANMKKTKLAELGVLPNSRPNKIIITEINLAAYFCAFCQLLTSFLLLESFYKNHNSAE